MAMSKALGDREYQKFEETTDGDTAVRVLEQTSNRKNYDENLLVADEITETLLESIHKQLKIMNVHLAQISGLELQPGDEET
jgi:hypothetical protein